MWIDADQDTYIWPNECVPEDRSGIKIGLVSIKTDFIVEQMKMRHIVYEV